MRQCRFISICDIIQLLTSMRLTYGFINPKKLIFTEARGRDEYGRWGLIIPFVIWLKRILSPDWSNLSGQISMSTWKPDQTLQSSSLVHIYLSLKEQYIPGNDRNFCTLWNQLLKFTTKALNKTRRLQADSINIYCKSESIESKV